MSNPAGFGIWNSKFLILSPADRTDRRSDASSATETHRHFAVFDNHGNRTAAVAEAEHALEPDRVFLDIDVFDVDMPPLVVVTGGLRVGSRVLSEDVHHSPILLRPQSDFSRTVARPQRQST
jgi:hypothetical protein